MLGHDTSTSTSLASPNAPPSPDAWMSHQSRASVISQTTVQPLILASAAAAAARTSSSMSRHSSQRSKRDSALELGGGIVQRLSQKKRPVSHSEAMAPTYRLYPHQASNGRRSLRAMEVSPDAERSFVAHDRSKSADAETFLGSNSESQYSQNSPVSGRPSTDDYAYPLERQDSSPSQMVTPEGEKQEEIYVSPVVSEVDERYDSAAPAREVPARGSSKHAPSRSIKYDRTVSQENLHVQDNLLSRSQSQVSTARPAQALHPRRSQPLTRKPSGSRTNYSRPASPDTLTERGYGPGDRSSAESILTQETAATSTHTLPALQTKGPDNSDVQQLEPVIEDDPRSWDLLEPDDHTHGSQGMYALEKRAEQMFSAEHLHAIFRDPKLLLRFTGFLNTHRAKSIAVLIYYLDALKALRAINYANAIAEALGPIPGQDFTQEAAAPTRNIALERKADAAFDILVREDLPAFIAHTWIQVVSVSIQRRITGTLAPHLREASEGLAEVFCLTDPSRADNPIVFASEEFVRTTQYGMNYLIGRNCRFLQGPHTSPNSVRRLAMSVVEGKEHTEVFVNYRRDGSPFMNLLMTAPLMDSRGNVRYYIGAQVDVSGLVKDCSHLEALAQIVEREADPEEAAAEEEEARRKDEFCELTEMFNSAELDTVRRYGGRMHKEYVDESDRESISGGRRRLLIKDSSPEGLFKHGGGGNAPNATLPATVRERINGKLEGVYQNYLLIRPAPSLRILFTSPSLRVPGILQSPFLDRIGGSARVRNDLRAALGEGRGVTAKIRWLTRADKNGEGEGRPRWIHCTPLFGHSGSVGVWMIVLVDEETGGVGSVAGSGRRFRAAPPVATVIGGKEWEGSRREMRSGYDGEGERRGGHGGGSRGAGVRSPEPERGYGNGVGRAVGGVPGSSHGSAMYGLASGDVSEFSFQLK